MKFNQPISIKEIARQLGIAVTGNELGMATGLNEIHQVELGDITFVDHPKYYHKAIHSNASFIIINTDYECPAGKALLHSNDPFSDYVKLAKMFLPFEPASNAISSSATIGVGTVIQPNVFVGNGVSIGNNCIIHANVSLYDNCIIGHNVIIHSNTSVGSDAFYYKKRNTPHVHYDKLYSCGSVIIEDNVEIGANCTIDKGVSGNTTIGWGTKIDNQVHIGHDTVIGKNCLIAAQVGIAGCAKIEDGVTLWGQVGVNKDLVIGENVVVYAQSGVPKSLEANKTYFGSPVQEARQKMKELALIKNLTQSQKK
jgi:UDP-3-O-[3-hydroxymyristoyl] glucosamine N-acyltransferase